MKCKISVFISSLNQNSLIFLPSQNFKFLSNCPWGDSCEIAVWCYIVLAFAKYIFSVIGLLLSHFWLLSCLSYTSYILSIYILPIHFTYHQFYILLQSSYSLFEEPSSHRCRGRSNLGSDLRIWGRRCYNPEGYNRRHRSICELPCCWITLTTLHVIHQLHITYHRIYHYYAYTHIHIAAPIANPQPR